MLQIMVYQYKNKAAKAAERVIFRVLQTKHKHICCFDKINGL